jgi:TRAP-type C4-dicarboxylate transport system permease small subunit
MLHRIGRALSRVLDMSQVLSAIMVFAMMIHITLDVVVRYATSQGFAATVEVVSYYYMVGIAFLPVAYAEKVNAHISVEVVTQSLSQRLQGIALYIAWLLSIVVYSLLAYRTFQDAEAARRIGTFVFTQNVRIDIWPAYYFLPVGFGLMVATLIYRCIVFFWPEQDGLGSGRSQVTVE